VNPRGRGHAARAGASSTDENERSKASGFCLDVTLLIFDIIFLLYIYTRLHLGHVLLKLLKFNKYCSTFVLFDKKFPILD
jgi:hypothetical protein